MCKFPFPRIHGPDHDLCMRSIDRKLLKVLGLVTYQQKDTIFLIGQIFDICALFLLLRLP